MNSSTSYWGEMIKNNKSDDEKKEYDPKAHIEWVVRNSLHIRTKPPFFIILIMAINWLKQQFQKTFRFVHFYFSVL